MDNLLWKFTSLLSTLVLGLCGYALTSHAQAQDDSPAALAPHIQRDIGLNEGQYRAYLAKEAVAVKANGLIRHSVGEGVFGGLYMSRQSDNTYENRVLLTDLQHSGLARKLGADKVILAKYSLKALYLNQAAVEKTIEQLQLWPFVHGVGIDVAGNKIVLEVATGREDEISKKIIAASGFSLDLFTVRSALRPPPPAIDIYGGDRYNQNWEVGSYCSVGFAAYRDGVSGFLTAGHCFARNAPLTLPALISSPAGVTYGQHFVTHWGCWAIIPGFG